MTQYAKWSDNKNLTCVEFLGGPGSGKSLCAAEIFVKMKKQQHNVELISEAAKGFVWDNWTAILQEQDYVFASQHRLQRRLVHHQVDYCISDSSLLLGLIYLKDNPPQSFIQYIKDVHSSYNNITIFLKRNNNFPYQEKGREQTFEQAVEIDQKIEHFLKVENINHHVVIAGPDATDQVLSIIANSKQ